MHGKADLMSTWMDFNTILVFVNSCVNPFLYGITLPKYRRGYWRVLRCWCNWRTYELKASARVGNHDMAVTRI